MISKYRCQKCGFKWQGYRVMPIMDRSYDVLRYVREKGPGMTVCPSCKHEIVAWTNYESFAVWLRKQR